MIKICLKDYILIKICCMCIILYNISNDFNILHADWNRDWNAELNTD